MVAKRSSHLPHACRLCYVLQAFIRAGPMIVKPPETRYAKGSDIRISGTSRT
jgi:hypothetical protein